MLRKHGHHGTLVVLRRVVDRGQPSFIRGIDIRTVEDQRFSYVDVAVCCCNVQRASLSWPRKLSPYCQQMNVQSNGTFDRC